MQEFLVTEQVKWKFNLSRTPWWGGQFERMVGLVKQCLYKATEKAKLKKQELEKNCDTLELNCDTWKRQKTVHQCSKQPLNASTSKFKPRRNAAAIAEVRIWDAAEANKDELWSSLFDPFCQIGGDWRKPCVTNVHRSYCTWEKETFSWSYKYDQLFWTFY